MSWLMETYTITNVNVDTNSNFGLSLTTTFRRISRLIQNLLHPKNRESDFGRVLFYFHLNLKIKKEQIMENLLKQKEILQDEMYKLADIHGLAHPLTVAKSQELDVIINKIMSQNDKRQDSRNGSIFVVDD